MLMHCVAAQLQERAQSLKPAGAGDIWRSSQNTAGSPIVFCYKTELVSRGGGGRPVNAAKHFVDPNRMQEHECWFQSRNHFFLAANAQAHAGENLQGPFGIPLTHGYVVDFPMAAGDHL